MENAEKRTHWISTEDLFGPEPEGLYRITNRYLGLSPDRQPPSELARIVKEFLAGRIREDRFYRSIREGTTGLDPRVRTPARSTEWIRKVHIEDSGGRARIAAQKMIRELSVTPAQRGGWSQDPLFALYGNMPSWYREIFKAAGVKEEWFSLLFLSCEMGFLEQEPGFQEILANTSLSK